MCPNTYRHMYKVFWRFWWYLIQMLPKLLHKECWIWQWLRSELNLLRVCNSLHEIRGICLSPLSDNLLVNFQKKLIMPKNFLNAPKLPDLLSLSSYSRLLPWGPLNRHLATLTVHRQLKTVILSGIEIAGNDGNLECISLSAIIRVLRPFNQHKVVKLKSAHFSLDIVCTSSPSMPAERSHSLVAFQKAKTKMV